jgi:4a-hydroxytetrahydrobiopterin dehydratase
MTQTSSELAAKSCVPCKKGTPPLKGQRLEELYRQLSGWKLIADHHLEKEYRFRDFKEALAFTNQVGELAEREGHHPDIQLSWGRVVIQLWTHKIQGLSENDFVMAAKCDALTPSR